MPRIQEYLPEEQAQGPQGGTSPALEAVGELGQGVERFGRSVTEGANAIEERTSTMEAADANAQMSDLKNEYYERVKDETNRGVLDQNKLFEDYDEQVNKVGANFDTPRGRAEFERASARTRGSMIRWAANGSAQIAGANAEADINKTVNNLTDLSQKDPASYFDNRAAILEMYNGHKNDEHLNLSPAALEKKEQAHLAQNADAAIQGLMRIDFDNISTDMALSGGKVNPTDEKYQRAQRALDSGSMDEYLGSKQKEELQRQIRQNANSAKAQGEWTIKSRQDKIDAQHDSVFAKIVPKIIDGTYPPKQAEDDFKGDPKKMESVVKFINTMNEPGVVENSPGYNNIIRRQLSNETDPGHINTQDKLIDAMQENNISLKYFKDLYSRMGDTPGARNQRVQEKQLFDSAKSIYAVSDSSGGGLPGKNSMSGVQLANFMKYVDEQKNEAIKNGEPLSPLFTPGNPKSLYNQIPRFHLSQEDSLRDLANGTVAQQVSSPTTVAQAAPTSLPPLSAGMMRYRDKSGNIYKASRKWFDAHGTKDDEEIR